MQRPRDHMQLGRMEELSYFSILRQQGGQLIVNHGKKGDFMQVTVMEGWKASWMSLDLHSYYRGKEWVGRRKEGRR